MHGGEKGVGYVDGNEKGAGYVDMDVDESRGRREVVC